MVELLSVKEKSFTFELILGEMIMTCQFSVFIVNLFELHQLHNSALLDLIFLEELRGLSERAEDKYHQQIVVEYSGQN